MSTFINLYREHHLPTTAVNFVIGFYDKLPKKNNPYYGLSILGMIKYNCDNYEQDKCVEEIAAVFEYYIKQWPKFTGDIEYPVPHDTLSPKEAFEANKDKLYHKNTKYGKANWELLDFIKTTMCDDQYKSTLRLYLVIFKERVDGGIFSVKENQSLRNNYRKMVKKYCKNISIDSVYNNAYGDVLDEYLNICDTDTLKDWVATYNYVINTIDAELKDIRDVYDKFNKGE